MAHQCVHCGKIFPVGSKEILEGCSNCGSHFFFYVREEQLEKLKKEPLEIPEKEKENIEAEIREIAGITQEDAPVILDLESVRITGEGKFELDLVNIFQKQRPIVYRIGEGKYIIDLTPTLKKNSKEMKELEKVKKSKKK
jgi:predicted  nucleic acid-binding Zn-ribbon protein